MAAGAQDVCLRHLSCLGKLTNLRLETGNVKNYDFLDELPEIHYINLRVHYTMEEDER